MTEPIIVHYRVTFDIVCEKGAAAIEHDVSERLHKIVEMELPACLEYGKIVEVTAGTFNVVRLP